MFLSALKTQTYTYVLAGTAIAVGMGWSNAIQASIETLFPKPDKNDKGLNKLKYVK